MPANSWTLPWTKNIIGPVGPVLWYFFALSKSKNKWTLAQSLLTRSKVQDLLTSFGHILALHCFVFSPPSAQNLTPQKEEEEVCVSHPPPEGTNYFQLWAEQRSHVWGETSIFFLPPPPDSFLFTKTQHKNEEQKSCMERGVGRGDYKECIEPQSFTVFLVWCCISQGERKDGRYEEGANRRVEGVGETRVVKTKEESGYSKKNKSILLRCENSVGF